MMMSLRSEIMTSELDDIDKKILRALRKTNGQDFASLRRMTSIGSDRTIERHVKHLSKLGLVKDEKISKGAKKYHNVIITRKGRNTR